MFNASILLALSLGKEREMLKASDLKMRRRHSPRTKRKPSKISRLNLLDFDLAFGSTGRCWLTWCSIPVVPISRPEAFIDGLRTVAESPKTFEDYFEDFVRGDTGAHVESMWRDELQGSDESIDSARLRLLQERLAFSAWSTAAAIAVGQSSRSLVDKYPIELLPEHSPCVGGFCFAVDPDMNDVCVDLRIHDSEQASELLETLLEEHGENCLFYEEEEPEAIIACIGCRIPVSPCTLTLAGFHFRVDLCLTLSFSSGQPLLFVDGPQELGIRLNDCPLVPSED